MPASFPREHRLQLPLLALGCDAVPNLGLSSGTEGISIALQDAPLHASSLHNGTPRVNASAAVRRGGHREAPSVRASSHPQARGAEARRASGGRRADRGSRCSDQPALVVAWQWQRSRFARDRKRSAGSERIPANWRFQRTGATGRERLLTDRTQEVAGSSPASSIKALLTRCFRRLNGKRSERCQQNGNGRLPCGAD
jgi:hypothetical protein